MNKLNKLSSFLIVLVLLLNIVGCGTETASNKDDFYDSVNHRQLNKWGDIPLDQKTINWFLIAKNNNDQKLNDLIKQITKDSSLEKGSDQYNISALYKTGIDMEKRNQGGYGLAEEHLKEIDSATNIFELLETMLRFNRQYGAISLAGIEINADPKNSSKYVLHLVNGNTGVSKEIWQLENQTQVKAYMKYLKNLWMIQGSTDEEATNIVDNVIKMMKNLANCSLSVEETFDPDKAYNVFNISDISSMFANQVSVDKLCQIYGVSAGEKIIVPDIKYFKQMATYLKNENLSILKNYIKSVIYTNYATFADKKSADAQETYYMEAYGTKEKSNEDHNVLEKIQSLLGYECGRIFCEKYFQESTKTNVKKMVDEVIQVYHKRIANLDWMSEETKQMAREKLNKIVTKIGYPDNWPQEKYDMILTPPQDNGLYINNQFIINQVKTNYMFSTKNDPVDRNKWVDYPQIVNAYYMATNNTIYLLAGILQSPFYNPQASKEENLGSIGFIIAHEITHAFDNNGAKFDANGNLNNWWTKDDFQKFNNLSKKVVEYYNYYDINGKPIDGTQTLSENIADLGAISCITEIAKNNKYDLKKMYKAYANMLASKSRDEYENACIAQDIHSPAKVRINAVLSAIDEFYNAYNIQENDQMYQKPEDRPSIW